MGHLKVELPFEIGAFLFFSLSGYLITRILLRGRDKIEAGHSTLPHLLRSFTIRRLLRLFPGYFIALSLYLILLSPDVIQNVWWYVTNSSNLHFARLGHWPGGADQFWTLAVDQQFYALWPFLVLLLPRATLPYAFLLIAALSPLSRTLSHHDLALFSGPMKDKLPWFLTDQLCIGAILAFLQETGRMPKRRTLWLTLILSLISYLLLRYELFSNTAESPLYIWQQTLLALFSTSLIGLCIEGVGGVGKAVLEHPITQYLGTRSYGYYLYHNLAFLLLGKVGFFLFPQEDSVTDPLFLIRLICAAGILYLMAHYSWKYIEEPLIMRKAKHRYQRA